MRAELAARLLAMRCAVTAVAAAAAWTPRAPLTPAHVPPRAWHSRPAFDPLALTDAECTDKTAGAAGGSAVHRPSSTSSPAPFGSMLTTTLE